MLEASKDLVFVYVTFASETVAHAVARLAVEARLAACVNIFPAHTSIYRWKSEIETQVEVAVIFKPVAPNIDELSRLIEREHSFDTPCIAVVTPSQMNSKFASWLRMELKK